MDTAAKQDQVLYVFDLRETVVESATRDIVTFGGLMATAWFLNTQIAPSAWLNAALAITWILWIGGKGILRKKRMTSAEARAWLDDHYPLTPETR